MRACLKGLLLAFCLTLTAWGAAVAQEDDTCSVEVTPSPDAAAEPGGCALNLDPLSVDVYRWQIESALLAGDYSEAVDGYMTLLAVIAPEHPDIFETLLADYERDLTTMPDDLVLLTGYAGLQWWVSDYAAAIHALDHLLEVEPDSVTALTFRGSAHFFMEDVDAGSADFARALELDPDNPNIYFLIADAYTYAMPDTERALDAALTANALGLASPRLDAIFGAAYTALDDDAAAAAYYAQHIASATSAFIDAAALAAGESVTLTIEPGQTYIIPLDVTAGETLDVMTGGDLDTIIALYAPDNTVVIGSDDRDGYFAGFTAQIDAAGTYRLYVTTFAAAGTGDLIVTRSS
jgi:hypothetical protein